MPKREEKLAAERFRRRLEKKLGECVTLPFSQEVWQYRALIERKKCRQVNRILMALAHFTKLKTSFPYPTKAEEFLREIDDSDSSYGRDESVLSEGYFLINQIYRGSPGVKIYLCENSVFSKKTKLNKVAVKIVNLKKTFGNYINENLKRELDVILQVKHPFIIETICVVYRLKQYYMFRRYAERGDLFAYLLNYGGVTEMRARLWMAQLASAILFLHSNDIAHNDLCCENILITEHFNLKVTDFENAIRINYEMGKICPTLDFRGSEEYASPEILRGRPYCPIGGDTWALGVILYALLTAHLPFSGQTNKELLDSQRVWRRDICSYFSRSLIILFKKVFRFKSKHRYGLKRFLNAEWFWIDDRLKEGGDLGEYSRPEKPDSRPLDDPARRRFIDDPAQDHTDGQEMVRFQPFILEKPSKTCLVPVVYTEDDLEATLSDDKSYGIPFEPGKEQAEHLQNLGKLWESKMESKKKKKREPESEKKSKEMAKLLCKTYFRTSHQNE